MLRKVLKGAAVVFVGPFPPPVYGQSAATEALADALAKSGIKIERIDVSGAAPLKIWRHLVAGWKIFWSRGPVYISANSNKGMWLSAGLALVARFRGMSPTIHHHAYEHVRRRRPAMVVLATVAGAEATHLVLGARMAEELRSRTAEVKKTLILNNAGLVDPSLLDIKRPTRKPQVLAHLSNLTGEKGIGDVVEATIMAVKKGFDVQLVVAGKPEDPDAERALTRARSELGSRFEFRGAVHGEDKIAFFRDADIFLFPSRYRNEAEPLVILEAMAAGIPCIAFDRGCIADDIGRAGGVTLSEDEPFAEAVCDYLAAVEPAPTMKKRSTAARTRFRRLHGEHEKQLAELTARLGEEPQSAKTRNGRGKTGRGSLVFLWENFGPYHLDRLSRVSEYFASTFDVIGIELFARSQVYDWEAAPDADLKLVTLFDGNRPRSFWSRLIRILRTLPPARGSFAFFCHYIRLEVFVAALLFRLRGGRVFVMNNSKFDDYERSLWREAGKRLFMLPYHGGLSNRGRSSDYMRFLGVPAGRIAGGYNTVGLQRVRQDAGVPPAPDGPAFRGRHFIAVARLVPKKNLGMLLDAYALYCKAIDAPRDLVLCGSGPEEEALKARAQDLGIAERVQFKGWQQAAEVARLLGGALVLILPSVEEQFGNVVIEAQALGLPAIISDNCGARDDLIRSGVNGFVVEPDNPAGLAYFMSELSGNEALWRRMATAAAESSWKCDTSRFVEGIEKLMSIEA